MKKEQKKIGTKYYLTNLYKKNKHIVTSYVLDYLEYDEWLKGKRKLEEVSVYSILFKVGKKLMGIDDAEYRYKDVMILPISRYTQYLLTQNEKNK